MCAYFQPTKQTPQPKILCWSSIYIYIGYQLNVSTMDDSYLHMKFGAVFPQANSWIYMKWERCHLMAQYKITNIDTLDLVFHKNVNFPWFLVGTIVDWGDLQVDVVRAVINAMGAAFP